MIHIPRLILTQMVLSLRSRAELQVENLALRHQIEILKRTAPKRARLSIPRRWCDGIAKASGSIGAGRRARAVVDRKLAMRWAGALFWKTPLFPLAFTGLKDLRGLVLEPSPEGRSG